MQTAMEVEHKRLANQLLSTGLQSARQGDRTKAIDQLYRSAVEFEKSQEYRGIPGVWEAVGRLLESGDGQISSSSTAGTDFDIEYRVIPDHVWLAHDDKQRIAWVYQWAAEHRERGGDFDTAFQLYLKAGKCAEETDEAISGNPRWPAKLYYRAVLSFVRAFGHTSDPKIEDALQKMHHHNMRLKVEQNQPERAYKSLAIAYCSIKSALIIAGNLLEARNIEQKELQATMRLHRVRKSYGNMIFHWLRSGGYVYFIMAWTLLVLAGFPSIYFLFDLIGSHGQTMDWTDAVRYSIETSLIIGHEDFHAVSLVGRFLAIAETALSYFGLGITLWYMTKKLE